MKWRGGQDCNSPHQIYRLEILGTTKCVVCGGYFVVCGEHLVVNRCILWFVAGIFQIVVSVLYIAVSVL